jgi:hypothetical protein
MFYMNFDDNITDKHGIIVRNWPLPVFCAPGDIRTVTELKILYNAWESGTAHFYRMTLAEATKWSNERFSRAVAETSGPGSVSSLTEPSTTTAPAELSIDQDPGTLGSAQVPSAINGSEQATSDPTMSEQINPDATTVNNFEHSTSSDPTMSEQTIINPDAITVNASDQANLNHTDPAASLPTCNISPTTPSASATTSGVKRTQATEAQPPPPSKRHRPALTPAFINTIVTSVDGAPVVMNKRARKQRSDKGKKRVKY